MSGKERLPNVMISGLALQLTDSINWSLSECYWIGETNELPCISFCAANLDALCPALNRFFTVLKYTIDHHLVNCQQFAVEQSQTKPIFLFLIVRAVMYCTTLFAFLMKNG
ncbi:hypothetical protein CHS0354_003834 [Potamilus streckersoni]|uniref:Uncharacterized protein n=1 Tax=Potamilus streckersoni TaxID=2493646 RepID=A0AAE0SGY0_9BIVA|nr:hypothetical protein CHS0354_003834 [Potamilus streckersoni]